MIAYVENLSRILTTLRNRWYVWIFLALAIIDWSLLRANLVGHPYWPLSGLVALAVGGWLTEMTRTIILMFRRRLGRVAAAGRLVTLTGLSLMFSLGVVNWLWSLQGYVVLRELEAVPLHGGSHLLAFETGPLSNLSTLDLTLQLEEVRMLPTPGGGLYPSSRLRVQDSTGDVTVFDVSPYEVADYGSLRFYQGAFGFAPRIVIVKDEVTIFDEVVPFMTQVHDPENYLSFEEVFTIEKEGLEVWGGIDLSSLDDAYRGHARLVLTMKHEGHLVGEGRLSIGHFAEIREGYRLGFAGLERWSEIDFSRRNYRRQMLWGFGLAVLGLTVLAIGALRSLWTAKKKID